MEVTAFVVSLIAISFAFVSLLLSIRADRRQQRAEERAERQETRENEEARARRSGWPAVVPSGGSGRPPSVRHKYAVRNAGQATITELWLWIADDSSGRQYGRRGGGKLTLAANESTDIVVDTTELFGPVGRFRPRKRPLDAILMVTWTDMDGSHTLRTDIRPPRRYE
jgi:hypothetical protein